MTRDTDPLAALGPDARRLCRAAVDALEAEDLLRTSSEDGVRCVVGAVLAEQRRIAAERDAAFEQDREAPRRTSAALVFLAGSTVATPYEAVQRRLTSTSPYLYTIEEDLPYGGRRLAGGDSGRTDVLAALDVALAAARSVGFTEYRVAGDPGGPRPLDEPLVATGAPVKRDPDRLARLHQEGRDPGRGVAMVEVQVRPPVTAYEARLLGLEPSAGGYHVLIYRPPGELEDEFTTGPGSLDRAIWRAVVTAHRLGFRYYQLAHGPGQTPTWIEPTYLELYDVARVAAVWSPPDPRLDPVSGLRPDPGGWTYRVYDGAGRVVASGSSGRDEQSRAGDRRTVLCALLAAQAAGFTRFSRAPGDAPRSIAEELCA